jgi:hypothetical protein
MAKRKPTPPPSPSDWAKRISEALKADFMAVVDATDWSATPSYMREFVEMHLDSIDNLAVDLTRAVQNVQNESNRIRTRLRRKPALPPMK